MQRLSQVLTGGCVQYPLFEDLTGLGWDNKDGTSRLSNVSNNCWHMLVQLENRLDDLAHYYPSYLSSERAQLASVLLPDGWQAGKGCQTLHEACSSERVLLHELGRRVISSAEPEAALRAAEQMHAMQLRLASAVAAAQAWLQNLQHFSKGDPLPLNPYQLSKSPGALGSFQPQLDRKDVLVPGGIHFIPCDLPLPDQACLLHT